MAMAKPLVFVLALALLARAPGILGQAPPDLGEPLAADVMQVLESGNRGQVLLDLLKFAEPKGGQLTDLLSNSDRPLLGTVLVPGKGTLARAILAQLARLPAAKASALATYLIFYHIIQTKAVRPKYTVKDFGSFSKPTDWSSSLLDSKNKPLLVSLKVFARAGTNKLPKQDFILASGVASGATFNVNAGALAGNSRVYFLDDILIPPSDAIYPLLPPSIYGLVEWSSVLTAPLPGLVTISKTKTQKWSGPKEGSSFIALVNADKALKAILSSASTAFTIFVPTNAAIDKYLKAKGIKLSAFPKSLLYHHVVTNRGYRFNDLITKNNATLGFSTFYTPSKQGASGLNWLFLAGQIIRNPSTPGSTLPDMNRPFVREVCPSSYCEAASGCVQFGRKTTSRLVTFRRTDQSFRYGNEVLAGKSTLLYIDTVLDLCEGTVKP